MRQKKLVEKALPTVLKCWIMWGRLWTRQTWGERSSDKRWGRFVRGTVVWQEMGQMWGERLSDRRWGRREGNDWWIRSHYNLCLKCLEFQLYTRKFCRGRLQVCPVVTCVPWHQTVSFMTKPQVAGIPRENNPITLQIIWPWQQWRNYGIQ